MPCRPDLKTCFNCQEWFDINNYYETEFYTDSPKPELCDICNQYICPFCHVCFCEADEKVAIAVKALEATYERWLKDIGIDDILLDIKEKEELCG